MLFSRPSPAASQQVAVDEMPEHLNWVTMVDNLAGGDILKHDDIYNLNYIYCLNVLAARYHKDKYIERINRANERKYNK